MLPVHRPELSAESREPGALRPPIDRLLALEHHGIKLGLETIATLLEALGNPHEQWPAIHIAGTNGKGSTAAMVERGLRAAGHRTGRYTSPHLDRLEERFAIDGEPVEPGTLASTVSSVLGLVDSLEANGRVGSPTFFEVTTAVAFELFRLARVDVAVVEVGLGGRFDATNVLLPLVSVITSIDFDHQKYLGTTLTAIAGEKAGIAKSGVPMVIGALPPDARAEVSRICEARDAPLVDASREVTVTSRAEAGRVSLAAVSPVRRYPPLTLALNGEHQLQNAVVALRTLEVCAARGLGVGQADIVAGLEEACWPGRLEWLPLRAGRLLVDAAHNPAGARALATYLQQSGAAPLPIVFAVMADKEVDEMLAALAPVASTLYATETGTARCLPAQALATRAQAVLPATTIVVETHPERAVACALAESGHAAVAGSIFLIGPLRARLLAGGP